MITKVEQQENVVAQHIFLAHGLRNQYKGDNENAKRTRSRPQGILDLYTP